MPIRAQRNRRLYSEWLEPRLVMAVDGFAAISGVLTEQVGAASAPLAFEQVDLYRDADQDGQLTAFDELLRQTQSDESGRYVFDYLGAGQYLVDLPNQAVAAKATSLTTQDAFGVRLGFLDSFAIPQEPLVVDGAGQPAFDQANDQSQADPPEILGFQRDVMLADSSGTSAASTQVMVDLGLLEFEASPGSGSQLQLVYDGFDEPSEINVFGLTDYTGQYSNAAGLRFGVLGQGGDELLDIQFFSTDGSSIARTVQVPQSLAATGLQTITAPFGARESTETPIDFGQVGAITLDLTPSSTSYSLVMSGIEIVGFSEQQVDFAVPATDLAVAFISLPSEATPGLLVSGSVLVSNLTDQPVSDAYVLFRVLDANQQALSVFAAGVGDLGANGSTTVPFSFTPPVSAVGPLTVSAEVIPGAGSDVNPGDNSVSQELPLSTLVTISGKVYIDANSNGVYDQGETGIPGVVVTLSSFAFAETPIDRVAITDSNGDYSFESLPRSVIYLIEEQQPQQFLDGQESLGIPSSVAVAPDSIYVHIVRSTDDASGFNFGELVPAEEPAPVVDAPPQEFVPPPDPVVVNVNRFLQRGFFNFRPAPRQPQLLGGASSIVETSASLGSAMGAVSPVLTERAVDDLDLDLLLDNLLEFMAPDALPVDLGDAPPSAEPGEQDTKEPNANRSSASVEGRQPTAPAESAPAEQHAAEGPTEDNESSPVAVLALAGVAVGITRTANRQRRKRRQEEPRP
ncbi:MAG: hypothetical protein KDA37_01015 [Planctomycetales bacterium]|nr:hypothetical protein [Planctomycetales bacterium]